MKVKRNTLLLLACLDVTLAKRSWPVTAFKMKYEGE